jgi:hypothetical protein
MASYFHPELGAWVHGYSEDAADTLGRSGWVDGNVWQQQQAAAAAERAQPEPEPEAPEPKSEEKAAVDSELETEP